MHSHVRHESLQSFVTLQLSSYYSIKLMLIFARARGTSEDPKSVAASVNFGLYQAV